MFSSPVVYVSFPLWLARSQQVIALFLKSTLMPWLLLCECMFSSPVNWSSVPIKRLFLLMMSVMDVTSDL